MPHLHQEYSPTGSEVNGSKYHTDFTAHITMMWGFHTMARHTQRSAPWKKMMCASCTLFFWSAIKETAPFLPASVFNLCYNILNRLLPLPWCITHGGTMNSAMATKAGDSHFPSAMLRVEMFLYLFTAPAHNEHIYYMHAISIYAHALWMNIQKKKFYTFTNVSHSAQTNVIFFIWLL